MKLARRGLRRDELSYRWRLGHLERLTKPSQGPEANDSGGEDDKGAVEVGVSLIADDEATELI
ncbi:hypothetical protein, partial [Methylocella sp.]|uniref:hypothetical protein n=1 Tax=Methylocella sp. TaxID=1978226 RepID=UPI0035B0A8EF